MDHLPTTVQSNMSVGYDVRAEDANPETTDENIIFQERKRNKNTQTCEKDFLLLEHFSKWNCQQRETTTQTTDEDFLLMEPKQNSSSQTTDEDFFLLQQTREASTQTTEEDFILLDASQNTNTQNAAGEFSTFDQVIYNRNSFTVKSEISEQNMKRKKSRDQMITHDECAHKRSRLEIFGMREHVSETFGEGDLSPDFPTCRKLSSNHTISDKNCYLGINPKFPNIAQLLSHIPGMQTFGCFYSTFSNIEENTASNMNFSPDSFSNSEKSNRKHAFSVNDKEADSSGQHENSPQSNWNKILLKPQTAVETKRVVKCLACRKKPISDHSKLKDGEIIYICCQCVSCSICENSLLKHILEHVTKPFYCNVCEIHYSEEGSHDSDQTCDVCLLKFDCKYQLEIHYLSHESFHETNCINCKKELRKHLISSNAVRKYKCCKCGNDFKYKRWFFNHNFSHSPLNIYKCDICRKDFKLQSNLLFHVNDNHPMCQICGKFLIHSYALEEHHLEEHEST